MPFSLNKKSALITGGTAGIGLAVAKRFIQHGAQVVISSRREEGESIAKEIGAHFIQADITIERDVHHLFDQARQVLGDLHLVINNAGMATHG